MEYVYAALLLHKAGKKVEEASLKKIVEAAGVKVDGARIKALVSALEGVNIEEALKQAAAAPVAAPAAGSDSGEAKKDEAPEVDKAKEEESAGAGLAALFG